MLVPVVSIGGQETALFLSRGERLVRGLRLRRRLRLDVVSVSLVALMQRALDRLAAERRWPVLG
jgi:hypothetical protein